MLDSLNLVINCTCALAV